MPGINGTDFTSNPWDTTFDAFTDLFGNAFYIIPISFIALALYIKTRNPMISFTFLWASSLLMASGNVFVGNPDLARVYILFTAAGIIGVIGSIYFMKK